MEDLLVTDLDGTLLRSDAQLSPRSIAVLGGALRQGLPLTYATARSHHSAGPILAALPLTLPAIVYNGAFAVDPRSGEPLQAHVLDAGVTEAVLALGRRSGVRPFISGFSAGHEVLLHGSAQNRGQADFLQGRRASGDPRLRDLETSRLPDQVIELHYTATAAELAELALAVRRDLGGTVTAMLSRDVYVEGFCHLEISDAHANKGAMLRWLAAHLGVDLTRVTVFGDGQNDLPMFQVAGHRIAVANAHPDLLAAADEIVAASDDNGVARRIEEYLRRQGGT